MADTPGKHHAIVQSTASSSMAIVQDKRTPHRPGGCVGILFQLFDWNRRFAKKKLFPKKFLPPVRPPKRVSKKFAGDDKMPISKFLLIAGDNSGGLSTTKNHPPETVQDTPMLAPSLVGRLMGLESIPSAPQKPRMAVDLENPKVSSSARHDLDLDLGDQGKLQLRTQNLHSTGNIDNKLSTAAHFESSLLSSSLQTNKNVLPRKQHRDKPSSSVKTPKILCKKNSATTNRLMEAAVKILEPGLQQRNRSRCAVTSVDSWQCNYPLEEGIDVSSSSLSIARESKPLFSGSHSRRLPSSVTSAQAKPNVQIRSRENIETKHLQRKQPREEVVPQQSSHITSVKERVAVRSSNGSKGSSTTGNMKTRVRPGTAPLALAEVRPETKSKVIERKTSYLAHGKRPNNNNNNKPNLARNRSSKSEKLNPATARGTKVQNTPCSMGKSGDLKNKSKSNLRKKSLVEGDVKSQIYQASNVQLSLSDSRVPPSIGTSFTGDELSALLEQKIRELNSLESMVEDGNSRSTATILEELISALTKGRPMMHRRHEEEIIDRYDCPDESNESPDPSSVIDSQWFKPENVKEKTDGGVVGLSNSPVSILEASFSTTDSFLSENLNSTPDGKPDAEFSDSAASNNRAIATNLEAISIMYNSNRFPGGNTTQDLDKNPSFVRQVISNIYMLLSWSCGSFPSCYESEDDVESLIVDALDSLLDSSWTGDMSFPIGRRFLLDYILEYLDRRYNCYFKCSGYKVWEKKRGFLLNSKKISSDVHLDIVKHAAVRNIDGIIDDEMRNLDGEWKGFGVEDETFDAATEIQQELFEALVEETVEDLFIG